MSSDELDGFNRKEFEDGFGSLERSLKFAALLQEMMPITPKDDLEMLSKVLAGRAVVKLLGRGLFGPEEERLAEVMLNKFEKLIHDLVARLPQEQSRQAASLSKDLTEQWLLKIQTALKE